MSEAKLREAFGLADSDEPKEQDEVEQEQLPADEPGDELDEPELEADDDDRPKKQVSYQDSDEEIEKAKASGWKTLDEHIAEGKDPASWKTAKHFNEYGDWVNRVKHLKSDFDQRLSNVNILYQGQLQQLQGQNEQLQRQRREAIEMGDVDAVTKLDNAIGQNALQTFQLNQSMQSQDTVVPNDPFGRTKLQLEMEMQFERENPWISQQDEKAKAMQQYFAQILDQGLPPKQQYELLTQKAKQLQSAPQTNPNRTKPAMTDGKHRQQGNSGSQLSWGDLSSDELSQWKAFGEMMFKGDKKAFLKACKDARKGA